MSTEPLAWLQSITPELPQISEKYWESEAKSSTAALMGNLSGLKNYFCDFANSFILLNSSYGLTNRDVQNAWIYSQWGHIAAKQAVIDLYNFRAALNGMYSERRRDKQFFRDINDPLFEKVRSEFKVKFPHTQELRQAVMHQGDLHSNADRTKKNKRDNGETKGNQYIGPYVNAMLYNNKLSLAFNGRLYDLDITMENVNLLRDLTVMTIDSFALYYK